MDLAEAKQRLEEAEAAFKQRPVVSFATFSTPHGELAVLVTDRLRRQCRKGRVWKSSAMLTALKNAAYGFDPRAMRSRGGSDGLFRMDRDFRPPNTMMKKLFDRFLDKPDPLVSELATTLATPPADWIPVRLVSHHMRLLGVLTQSEPQCQLALVDYDDDKH